MTSSNKSYEIELLPFNMSGARDTMYRLGRKFEVTQPVVLKLTEEQVEVFENDWRFKITDSTDEGGTLEGGTVSASETVSPTADTETEKEIVDSETETVQDSDVEPQETVGGETAQDSELDELLFNNDKDELVEIAKELGIKKAHKFKSKQEVAQAIVDAR